MKVIPPNSSELAFRQIERILNLNPLAMSQYYSTLFTAFKNLMLMMNDEDNFNELDKKMKDVEKWLSDEFNPMTLSEAEMRMWNNMDLLSGFEVNGQMITQMEINQRLEEIKQWLISIHFEYMRYIRWTAQIKMD